MLALLGFPSVLLWMVPWNHVHPRASANESSFVASPQVVVIEPGEHDFPKSHARARVKSNLLQMIPLSRDQVAEVVLMEIPCGYISDPFTWLTEAAK